MNANKVKYNFKCKAKDLQVGDVINVLGGGASVPWATGIVKKIEGAAIHIFRPYGATADFIHSGGVICYIGIEQFCIYMSDEEYHVYQRQELK